MGESTKSLRAKRFGGWAFLKRLGQVTLLYAIGVLTLSATEPSPLTASVSARRIENFTLHDVAGRPQSLSDIQERLVVVAFLGTECPLAKLYGPKLEELREKFGPEGVAFWAVFPNVQDSLSEIADFAREHRVTFAILRDSDCRVADLFQATRTPEVFVLDEQRRIRYRGRVDGQFTFGSGVGLAAPAPKRGDLAIALEELLAGKPVSVPVTAAKGCLIGRPRKPQAGANVTYARQISRLFQRRCVECHRDGQIAPFALTHYDEAAGWGEMIAEVVREGRMPPWHADPRYGHFSNENRLSDEERALIAAWVESGCPEGDPQELPPPLQFHSKWFMPREPDQVIHMAEQPVDIKASGVEDYRYYEVDPGFEQDRWVSMAECRPGNRQVVHHIIVYIKSPQAKSSNIGAYELLCGFAPGTRPQQLPVGWARKIPAGSKLIFEMHYTPIGTAQQDRSSLGLIFIDESEVTHHCWTTNAINTDFEIPPHAPNYRVTAESPFDEPVQLLSLFPHMHMRGKSFRYELRYPDGRRQVLLDVPQYDFNWQTSFILDQPLDIPRGAEMHCTAHFDNSAENPANPDPAAAVRWGEQTWQEMLIGWFDVAAPRKR